MAFVLRELRMGASSVWWVAVGGGVAFLVLQRSGRNGRSVRGLFEDCSVGIAVVMAGVGVLLRFGSLDVYHGVFQGAAGISLLLTLGLWIGLPDRMIPARFVAAWAVPGLGHWMIGKAAKALFFLLSIGSLYVVGLYMTSFRSVAYEDMPYYYYGHLFSGFSSLIGWLLSGEKARLPEGWDYTHFDPAMLYVCAPALLNYIVALNVLERGPDGAVEKPDTGAPVSAAAASGGTAA